MKVTIFEQKIRRYGNTTNAKIRCGITDNSNFIEFIESSVKEFSANAKCKYNDNYDFKIGKRIALARAEIKAYKYYKNFLIKLHYKYQTLATDSFALYNKILKQISHNKEYIENIVSGSNN